MRLDIALAVWEHQVDLTLRARDLPTLEHRCELRTIAVSNRSRAIILGDGRLAVRREVCHEDMLDGPYLVEVVKGAKRGAQAEWGSVWGSA